MGSPIPMEPVRIEISAGVVVYRRDSDSGVQLLLIKDRYGNWGLPKGHVEEGESSREAALRECEEETGLSRLELVEGLGTIDWYFRFGDARVHKYCDYFLVEAGRGDLARPQHDEGVQMTRWVSPDTALAEVTYANARLIVERALGSLDDGPAAVAVEDEEEAVEEEEESEIDDAARGDGRLVFLTGGTGFVGGHVARRLVERGHRLRALVRRSEDAERLAELGAELVEGDITRRESLGDSLDECDAVVHLVGIIREKPPKITFERVHVEGTRNVVEAAYRSGVRKFVHMSALGAKPEGTAYHRSKYEAERVVRDAPISHVIFRPSIIAGPGSEFVALITRLVRLAPIVPVIGSGEYRLQPIDVEDVATAFTLAVERDDLRDETYEIGGPHKLTYNRVVEIVAEELSIRRRRFHLPLGLVQPVVGLASGLGLPTPINSDELQMMLEENVVRSDRNAIREVFQIDPTPFRTVLQRMQDERS